MAFISVFAQQSPPGSPQVNVAINAQIIERVCHKIMMAVFLTEVVKRREVC
jgi:hypothetical protein